jgi:hypothetical protein
LFPKGSLLATPRPVLLQLSQLSRDLESFRDSFVRDLEPPASAPPLGVGLPRQGRFALPGEGAQARRSFPRDIPPASNV